MQFTEPEDQPLFIKEVKMLAQISHLNIVAFKGMMHDYSTIFMEVMQCSLKPFTDEEIAVSSLDKLLMEFDKNSFQGFVNIVSVVAHNIISAMAYLHTNGIAHRDLKSPNIHISNYCSLSLSTYGQ